MAWIESHQELAHHPKTRRAARLLDSSIPAVIGHLHLLWWWALSYAEDGNISNFTPDEIAEAAMWNDEPDEFIEALTNCGMGKQVGFIEQSNGQMLLHDWWNYGGKWVEKRRSDARRKRLQRTSDGHPPDVTVDGARREPTEEKQQRETTTQRRASVVAEDWTPTDDQLSKAREKYPHLSIATEAEKFREWHGAKGTKYSDWSRAFWMWLRKASEFNPPAPLRPELVTYVPPPKVSCEHGTPQCEPCRRAAIAKAKELVSQTVKSA